MGLTNKFLIKNVNFVFVAYDKLKKIYSNYQVYNFGNPVRNLKIQSSLESYDHFKLDNKKKTILVIGGSLGAKSINEAILNNISLIRESSYQILWQTGKFYHDEILSHNLKADNLIIKPFIDRMDIAYSLADLIISRAGAIAISELCVISKPLILIPSPNVVDDHQTKNATEISKSGGCIIIKDQDAKNLMMNESISILENNSRKTSMIDSLRKLSKPNSAKDIVKKIYEIYDSKN
jgi:UDP-N-acetylglucosamine--N-acetylmuramyl-(pentapeptide) pyrophosphoryl-undecaprenol N-acetylglucosamine transferase